MDHPLWTRQEHGAEHLGSATLVVDSRGVIVFASAQVADIAGVTPHDVLGRRYDDGAWQVQDHDGEVLPPDEYPIARALRGERVEGVPLVADGPDGSRLLILADADPVWIDGIGQCAAVTMRDVAETASVERELRTSRARLAAIFDHALEAIVLADSTGTYVAANPAAGRLLGYEPESLVGLTFDDVIVDRLNASTSLDDFVAAGTATSEVRLRRADGGLVDVAAHSVANVEPGVHLSIWRDITEHKRMIDELAISEERLAAIVEGVSVGLLLVDAEGHVAYANAAARSMLAGPVLDRPAVTALASTFDDLDTITDAMSVAAPTPGTELVLTSTDGRRIRVVTTGISGGAGGRIVHLEDVSTREQAAQRLREALDRERAANEELAHVTALKDTFLSAVSHELRTPMTAIQGFASTLVDHADDLDDQQRALLVERLSANSERLRRLLDDLLDVDRLRRGAGSVTMAATSLRELVTSATAAVESPEHDISITAADLVVRVDRPKLERVVENLVSNAVRHTPAGTRVTVSASVVAGELVLVVDDSGPGVAPGRRAQVFEMFNKGASEQARTTGTGVGLALVHEFVALMGGTVALTEAGLGGASFTVRLPAAPAD